ncbi:myoneurin-like [Cloeon dipterum]|uniref:myoneurin-like n=1 Tax=Cloeon dipterum TaxID=197152 RepID=UPI00322031AB
MDLPANGSGGPSILQPCCTKKKFDDFEMLKMYTIAYNPTPTEVELHKNHLFDLKLKCAALISELENQRLLKKSGEDLILLEKLKVSVIEIDLKYEATTLASREWLQHKQADGSVGNNLNLASFQRLDQCFGQRLCQHAQNRPSYSSLPVAMINPDVHTQQPAQSSSVSQNPVPHYVGEPANENNQNIQDTTSSNGNEGPAAQEAAPAPSPKSSQTQIENSRRDESCEPPLASPTPEEENTGLVSDTNVSETSPVKSASENSPRRRLYRVFKVTTVPRRGRSRGLTSPSSKKVTDEQAAPTLSSQILADEEDGPQDDDQSIAPESPATPADDGKTDSVILLTSESGESSDEEFRSASSDQMALTSTNNSIASKPSQESAKLKNLHAINYHLDHEKFERTTECIICGKHSRDITKHYKSLHPNSEVLISRMSAAAFKKAKSEVHTMPPMTGTFQCRLCPMLMRRLNTFKDHITYHTGEYNYGCSACNFTSPKIDFLADHKYKHKGMFGKVPTLRKLDAFPEPSVASFIPGYVCPVCHWVQLNKESVQKHLKEAHKLTKGMNAIVVNMVSAVKSKLSEAGASRSKRKRQSADGDGD